MRIWFQFLQVCREMEVIVKHISTNHGRLEKSVVFEDGMIAPKGFIWDGMTMHKIARIEKWGPRVDKASLRHDLIYVYEGNVSPKHQYTRKQADLLLYNDLLESNVPQLHTKYIYLLVRIFGGVKWPGKKTELLTKK